MKKQKQNSPSGKDSSVDIMSEIRKKLSETDKKSVTSGNDLEDDLTASLLEDDSNNFVDDNAVDNNISSDDDIVVNVDEDIVNLNKMTKNKASEDQDNFEDDLLSEDHINNILEDESEDNDINLNEENVGDDSDIVSTSVQNVGNIHDYQRVASATVMNDKVSDKMNNINVNVSENKKSNFISQQKVLNDNDVKNSVKVSENMQTKSNISTDNVVQIPHVSEKIINGTRSSIEKLMETVKGQIEQKNDFSGSLKTKSLEQFISDLVEPKVVEFLEKNLIDIVNNVVEKHIQEIIDRK